MAEYYNATTESKADQEDQLSLALRPNGPGGTHAAQTLETAFVLLGHESHFGDRL
jgi:hypothetical protein